MQKVGGGALVLASVLFWGSWLLMPGVGVTDTARIFEIVGQRRGEVFASVVVQLASAALYAPAIVGLVLSRPHRRSVHVGATLVAVGAMGSAADAIFHLVAYEMTAPDIASAHVAPVMIRLQGPDLALLLPFVLAFFAGHGIVAWSMRREGRFAKAGLFSFAAFPALLLVGGPLARSGLLPPRFVGLGVLGLVSASLALVGLELSLSQSPRTSEA